MSAPKVFVSSTCYDLRQIRQDIEGFISSYGYTPILSERHGVTYNVTNTLENDCYNELSQCDIVIGIIGGKFGSESLDESGNSITMNEMLHAITLNKQIYIFIERNVSTEYSTYCSNKDVKGFVPAFVDDVRIFQFIEKIKSHHNIIINDFLTASEIVECLRGQLAGLFQTFLYNKEQQRHNEGLLTIKNLADRLNKVIDEIDSSTRNLNDKADTLYYNLETTRLTVNPALLEISRVLINSKHEFGQADNHSIIFFKTKDELLDLLECIFGFEATFESENILICGDKKLYIDLNFLFSEQGRLQFIAKNAIQQYEKDHQQPFIYIWDTREENTDFEDSDVPF